MSVLVIDDEAVVRELMLEILADAGYEPVGAADAERALELLSHPEISIVVSDIMMPGLTGLELLARIRATRPSLPVVMVTGAGTPANLSSALALGADGLVMKPFSHQDLLDAVATALDRADRSERELRERLLTPTLAGALANAIEAREPSLHGHCERLAALAVRLGEQLSLTSARIETIRLGAILHDIGKIGIPDRILLKPGAFTDEERAVMQTHTLIGDRLLEPIDLLQDVRPVVRHHHERWDGEGYPDGLAGERIPIEARIVSVADAVEAMSAQRPYRGPLSAEAVVSQLLEGHGAQWDPAVVDTVLELVETGAVGIGEAGLALGPSDSARTPRFPVLLVEEDPADAETARRSLEGAVTGISVSLATDGAAATELCRSASWSLVVLGDLDLLGELRGRAPTLPIVALTRPDGAAEAVRRGASDYVVKQNGYAAELAGRVRALLEVA